MWLCHASIHFFNGYFEVKYGLVKHRVYFTDIKRVKLVNRLKVQSALFMVLPLVLPFLLLLDKHGTTDAVTMLLLCGIALVLFIIAVVKRERTYYVAIARNGHKDLYLFVARPELKAAQAFIAKLERIKKTGFYSV